MPGNPEALSKKNGWSYKRLRAETGKQPAAEEVARALEIIEMLTVLAIAGLLDLRFGDETAFSLNPNIPYGWGPIGEQQGIKCIKGGNLNVFGLLDVQHERLTSYCTEGRVNSLQMIEWLDDFAATLTGPTVVVLDNAPWHRSQAFIAKLPDWESRQLFIYHLPAYCPHLNPIEITWRMMKYQWLRPKDFASQEALHQRIRYILANFQAPEFTLHYTKNKLAA